MTQLGMLGGMGIVEVIIILFIIALPIAIIILIIKAINKGKK